MKTWVVIIIFLSCAALVGAVIVDWYKDNIIDDLKTQAVKLGYAHVVAIDNKLEWQWIKPDMQMYFTDDEGNDTLVDEKSILWMK